MGCEQMCQVEILKSQPNEKFATHNDDDATDF